MRHLKAGRRLGRNASHRLALFRNLTRALIEHESIITTVAKAKEVRPFVEKLITLAKKGTLHHRRLAIARLRDEAAVAKLFKEIGPRFADRAGGYTRIVKRLERREQIAADKEGVEKVFAMQAGREIRVMVKPDKVDDIQAQVIARDIAKQVEEELTYPGQIRVTVVRESRATEFAR